VGGDVGIAIAIFDIAALGVSMQNMGGDLGAGARLPRRSRAGLTLNYTDPRVPTACSRPWKRSGRKTARPSSFKGSRAAS